MRYYEVHTPGQEKPRSTTRIRDLRELPVGTHIECVITDRDGGPLDSYSIPILNGRPDLRRGRAKHRAKAIAGL